MKWRCVHLCLSHFAYHIRYQPSRTVWHTFYFDFLKFVFLYLAASGLNGCMRDLSLQGVGSQAVVRGFSCSVVCGILVLRPGIKAACHALQGGFLTMGPPERSVLWFFDNKLKIFVQLAKGGWVVLSSSYIIE